MCTVLLGFQLFADTPLIVAANRDELRARSSDTPLLLSDDPPIYGGRDRLAGGTWLGVDPRGRVSTLTNRFLPGRPIDRDAGRHSRGEIALDVLRADGDVGAKTALQSLRAADFNPANILYASTTAAFCLTLDDEQGEALTELSPGIHVLTVVGLNQAVDPKSAWLMEKTRKSAQTAGDAAALLEAWKDLLVTHDQIAGTPQSAICIHGEIYGTVSSETVVSGVAGTEFTHAEGFPCQNSYKKVDLAVSFA